MYHDGCQDLSISIQNIASAFPKPWAKASIPRSRRKCKIFSSNLVVHASDCWLHFEKKPKVPLWDWAIQVCVFQHDSLWIPCWLFSFIPYHMVQGNLTAAARGKDLEDGTKTVEILFGVIFVQWGSTVVLFLLTCCIYPPTSYSCKSWGVDPSHLLLGWDVNFQALEVWATNASHWRRA